MSRRFEDKVVIVSGAGSVGAGWGNGRAAAVLFAQEGATVFGCDRSLAAMEETAARIAAFGGRFTPVECDVTGNDAVRAMVADCHARFGRIDVLVNNVGGSAAGGPDCCSGTPEGAACAGRVWRGGGGAGRPCGGRGCCCCC